MALDATVEKPRVCPACEEPEEEGKPHDMQCLYERAVMEINRLNQRWFKLRLEVEKLYHTGDAADVLNILDKMDKE